MLTRQRILATLFVAFVVSAAGLSRFAGAGASVGLHGQTELGGYANNRSPRIRPEAGLIRYGSGNWHTLTNTRRYGVLIVGAANAKTAGAQPGRTLIYGVWRGHSEGQLVSELWRLMEGGGGKGLVAQGR